MFTREFWLPWRPGGIRWSHLVSAGAGACILHLLLAFAVFLGGFLAGREYVLSTGYKPAPLIAPVAHLYGGGVPAAVSLAPFLARLHQQGASESCVGQALSTMVEIYQDELTYRRTAKHLREGYSAGYIWNQAANYLDQPITFNAAFGVLVSQGDDSLAEFPSDGQSVWIAPTAHQVRDAYPVHYLGWEAINRWDTGTIRAELAAGRPIAIAMPWSESLVNYQGTSPIYAQTGAFRYWHVVTAIGYDATGVQIVNSLDQPWGNRGRATFAWSFLEDPTNQADLAIAMPNTPLPAQYHPPKPKPLFPTKRFESYRTAHHLKAIPYKDSRGRVTWPASIFVAHQKLGGIKSAGSWHRGRPGYSKYPFAHGTAYGWPKTHRYTIVWVR
jgi:hypothetical protein